MPDLGFVSNWDFPHGSALAACPDPGALWPHLPSHWFQLKPRRSSHMAQRCMQREKAKLRAKDEDEDFRSPITITFYSHTLPRLLSFKRLAQAHVSGCCDLSREGVSLPKCHWRSPSRSSCFASSFRDRPNSHQLSTENLHPSEDRWPLRRHDESWWRPYFGLGTVCRFFSLPTNGHQRHMCPKPPGDDIQWRSCAPDGPPVCSHTAGRDAGAWAEGGGGIGHVASCM